MYLRAVLCTFQISVDFYFVLYLWVGEEGGEEGGKEGGEGAWSGGGGLEGGG